MLLQRLIAWLTPRAAILREPELQVAVNGIRFWTLHAAEDELDWLEQHGRIPDICLVRRRADGSYARVP